MKRDTIAIVQPYRTKENILNPLCLLPVSYTHLDVYKRQQQQLARAVIEANRNTVVVVQAGGVVDLACAEDASAILYAYLSGQAGGAALYDLIFGEVSPSGKLPETFPLRLEDTPCYDSFGLRDTFYTEKTAMGYRYYNAVKMCIRDSLSEE